MGKSNTCGLTVFSHEWLVGTVWPTTLLAEADFFPKGVDIPTISNSGKMFRELVPDLEESAEKMPCLWSHG